ncbi:hypothetical protein BH18ACT15_BH18ACT15_10290 [soil metagenome]
MAIRIQCLVIDSHDCPALARFWAETLGWRVTYEDDHQSVVEPPEGSVELDVVPDLLFVKVLDDKTTKNRLHLDLRPTDQGATVERLLALGARPAEVGQSDDVRWTVLADPEENEFCVLPPLPI